MGHCNSSTKAIRKTNTPQSNTILLIGKYETKNEVFELQINDKYIKII
jgi:hypothetical protein